MIVMMCSGFRHTLALGKCRLTVVLSYITIVGNSGPSMCFYIYINLNNNNKMFLKGAMCKSFEYPFTEMQYDIHNYVFSGLYLHNLWATIILI